MSIFISALALVVLYISAISISKCGNKYYWFFELAHFLGGFFVAMFLFNFSFGSKEIILLVIFTGILWELGELAVNKNKKIQNFMINKFNHYVAKVTLPDTILDLFLDILGALVFVYLFR